MTEVVPWGKEPKAKSNFLAWLSRHDEAKQMQLARQGREGGSNYRLLCAYLPRGTRGVMIGDRLRRVYATEDM
jgi:hypothetical protein